MDTLSHYRALVQRILLEHTRVPYAHGEIEIQPVFDTVRDHYLIMLVGWDPKRVHGALVHIDIIDGKFWVQRDGMEHGIVNDLEEAGVPKEHIVLAFKPARDRPLTGYAY